MNIQHISHLADLPESMHQKAIKARRIAVSNPSLVQVDIELLPWVYDEDKKQWLSFNGNFSASSPMEKEAQQIERIKKQEEYRENAIREMIDQMCAAVHWSFVRKCVIQRDKNTCQLCGKTRGEVGKSLHVHHVMKRKEGGTDHFDNLILVCFKCHMSADKKLYNPDWTTCSDEDKARARKWLEQNGHLDFSTVNSIALDKPPP